MALLGCGGPYGVNRPTCALKYATAGSGKLVNWTTGGYDWRESSSHPPDHELCKTTLRLHHLITSPVYACMLGGGGGAGGYFPEVNRSGPRDIRSFSWLCLFQDTRRLGTSSLFNIILTTDYRWFWKSMFRLRQFHIWWVSEVCVALREPSGEGQSPFRLDAMALPIPGHLLTEVTTHPIADLILVHVCTKF